jgi:predicted FMN-binding regulatory protein PaiB
VIQAKACRDPSKGLWGSKQPNYEVLNLYILTIEIKIKRFDCTTNIKMSQNKIHIVCGFAEVNKTNGLE